MTGRVRVFDRIVVVDWSARSTPATGPDSIWIAGTDRTQETGDRPSTVTWNPATRRAAVDLLVTLVREIPGPVLLAIDASVGFPTGTAAALGLGLPGGDQGDDADRDDCVDGDRRDDGDHRDDGDDGEAAPPWRRLWTELSGSIVDDERNANNRFAVASEWNRRISGRPGPFWGCPPTARTDTLTSTKPAHPSDLVPEWRECERALRASGRRPFSCWQLLGAGSVASQSLLAIVALDGLRRRLASDGVEVDIWPFTTGLRATTGATGATGTTGADGRRNGTRRTRRVVIAECWPSLFVQGSGADDGRVRDERQVAETAAVLSARDADGDLVEWFAPDLPRRVAAAAVNEEGWILGIDSAG